MVNGDIQGLYSKRSGFLVGMQNLKFKDINGAIQVGNVE